MILSEVPKFDKVLIDADSLLYRCGFASDKEDPSHAMHSLKNQLQSIKECTSQNALIYIKGNGNFRNEIAITTVYKGTRSREKPSMYEELREYIIKVHNAIPVNGMEADDMVSVLLYKERGINSRVVLAALDKDLWNTPGWHYNYHPKKMSLEYITTWQADRNFLMQMLTGDYTDNIPGIPGIGPKTAKEILCTKCNKVAYRNVYNEYTKYGLSLGWSSATIDDYFLEQGRLLWMTRELDHKGNPVLWQPLK